MLGKLLQSGQYTENQDVMTALMDVLFVIVKEIVDVVPELTGDVCCEMMVIINMMMMMMMD